MKIQRVTGDNSELRGLQDSDAIRKSQMAVNQGGTAEQFGPFSGIEVPGGFVVLEDYARMGIY